MAVCYATNCTWYVNPNGNSKAIWKGEVKGAMQSKEVIFLKGSLGARDRCAACKEARRQFCGIHGDLVCWDAANRRSIRVCRGDPCPKQVKPPTGRSGSGGGSGTGTPTPSPNTKTACQQRLGVDADCCNYGNLGGFGEWWCIQGKSATKGLQAGGVLAGDIGNQVGKWMPVILAGFAGLALILVFKQFN